MNNKKSKQLRKETQLVNRQVTDIVQNTVIRMSKMPFKKRVIMAFKILRGNI